MTKSLASNKKMALQMQINTKSKFPKGTENVMPAFSHLALICGLAIDSMPREGFADLVEALRNREEWVRKLNLMQNI